MKITGFDIYQYTLPLKPGLTVLGNPLTQREGLIIHLHGNDKAEGFGEISPLPGFNKESLAEALEQAKECKQQLVGQNIPSGIEKLNGKFQSWLGPMGLKPSVRFGVEMAVLNLLANAANVPLIQLISKEIHTQIRVNALLQGPKSTVLSQAQALIDQGYKAIKLKATGKNIAENIDLVRSVNGVISGQALLHVDVNQQWTLNEAIEFGNEVGLAAMDYIEEPFREIEEIPQFFMQTTIPVALDESLQKFSFNDIKSIEGVDVLVLKPTFLGGIERTWDWMNHARRFALETVISSSFETGVGLLALANLSGATYRETTAGLDTLKWFENDLLKGGLEIHKGKMNITGRLLHQDNLNHQYMRAV
ncbi:MAG: o-succinylbenzoate synthase [Candidatus Omnitrophota bacterium]|nr:o-succinylbenzoate synthase [Candidatus Omnitrophota bacterium]